jgi:hypothetical protein
MHRDGGNYVNFVPTLKINFILYDITRKSPAFFCRQSLDRALEERNLNFSDDLDYIYVRQGDVLAYGSPLSEKAIKVYEEYKQRAAERNYCPMAILKTQMYGHHVIAYDKIKAGTLLCEYAGQVINWKITLNSDSIMNLDNNYCISPFKSTNIARFISGIAKGGTPNVASVRGVYKGRLIVLLYALTNIKSGDILKYEYNGEHQDYDTSQFE